MSNDLIKLAGLYENESKAGNKYFVGLLNSGAKLVMLANRDRADNEPHWTLFVTTREKPAGDRQGGENAAPGLRDTAAPAPPIAAPPTRSRKAKPAELLPFYDDPIPPNLGG